MGAGALFSTGWAMSQTASVHPAKPTALILTSASSRTAMAAAFAAKHHKIPLEVVGLTSSANVDFVRGSGLYDTVCVYDDVESLKTQRAAVLDMAGDAAVQERLYSHFGGDLVYWGSVGMTHVQSAGRMASIKGTGGAPPVQCLVFTAVAEVGEVYGSDVVAKMMSDCSAAYKTAVFPAFRPVRRFGPEDTLNVYTEMAQGGADPACSYICSLWPEALHEPQVASSRL